MHTAVAMAKLETFMMPENFVHTKWHMQNQNLFERENAHIQI